jgi:hypothetical protein
MITSVNAISEQVAASTVHFEEDAMVITLSDNRVLSVPVNQIEWLRWLAQATPAQRDNWTIEPGGFAIYWEDLDNGVEIEHLLTIWSLQ